MIRLFAVNHDYQRSLTTEPAQAVVSRDDGTGSCSQDIETLLRPLYVRLRLTDEGKRSGADFFDLARSSIGELPTSESFTELSAPSYSWCRPRHAGRGAVRAHHPGHAGRGAARACAPVLAAALPCLARGGA